MCYHYTIGLKPVFPACIRVYRAMLDTNSLYKPPSTAQQSLNYFQRISKTSRILQSLNFSYLLWIKFFVGSIALQDFKPRPRVDCPFYVYEDCIGFSQHLSFDCQHYHLQGFEVEAKSFSATSMHSRLIVGSGRNRPFSISIFSRAPIWQPEFFKRLPLFSNNWIIPTSL